MKRAALRVRRTPAALSMQIKKLGDRVVHEEPLAWVGCDGGRAWRQRPMPVAIALQGCAWRRQAQSTLDAAGIEWRIAYTSESYAAHKSAVAADLAVAPLPKSVIESGLRRLGVAEGLSEPGISQIAVRLAPRPEAYDAAMVLAEQVSQSFAEAGKAGFQAIPDLRRAGPVRFERRLPRQADIAGLGVHSIGSVLVAPAQEGNWFCAADRDREDGLRTVDSGGLGSPPLCRG